MKKFLLTFTLFAVSSLFATPEWGSDFASMSAFQKSAGRSSYVKPIATYMGTVLNGSWVTGASIDKSLVFEAGMPFNIAFISDDDRSYNFNGIQIPTIFGDKFEMELGGSKELHNLSVFTLPYLQMGLSAFYTRIALRAMYFPSISQLKGYHLFGFGLQHSFGHFFVDKLPAPLKGLDVSLFFGYNSAYVGYTPEDWEGQLDLDFGSTHTAFIIGYKPIPFVEVMLSLGYQTVSMEASGNMIEYDGNVATGRTVKPDVNVDGNGGFRLGFEVAFSFGAFHPTIGVNAGANTSLNANVLYFKQTLLELNRSEAKDDPVNHVVQEPEEEGSK